MIRLVTPELESAFVHFCNTDSVFCAKIYSQYQMYGLQSGIVDFWLMFGGKTPIGILSGCGGKFTLASEQIADTSELAAFLQAAGAKTLEAERSLLGGLGFLRESGLILRADAPPAPDGSPVQPVDSLTQVWELLCAADREFAGLAQYDAWLAEVSHKIRHGLAQCYIIHAGGRLAATASLLFKNADCAVIAAVATHPDFRGCGFGRRVAGQATASAFAQGLRPAVLIRDAGLQKFYARCGYRPAGEWGEVQILPPQF